MTYAVLWGQATLASLPKVWSSSSATSDDMTPIPFLCETAILAPAGLGGECLFAYAHITVSSSLSATLKVTPLIDGDAAASVQLASTVVVRAVTVPATRGTSAVPTLRSVTLPGSTIQVVTPIFALAQQTATLPGQVPPRVTNTYAVPLLRKLVDYQGIEQSRFFCRGARLSLRIESVGALGAGELIIDGVDVEFEVLRKAKFLSVSA